MVVDGVVERDKVWVLFRDVVQDHLLIAAPEVQVFQPDQVALVLDPADDGGQIRDSREDGRDKAGGAHPRVVEDLHGGQPPLNVDGAVHVVLEILIQGVDRPGHPGVGKGLDEIQIPQHQVALGGNADGAAAALHLFEQGPGATGGFLQGLVGVAHRADEQLFSRIASRIFDLRPVLHVHKAAPGLRVVGEPLHKGGVAVLAGVFTAHIGADRVVGHRQVGFGEDAFDGDVFYHAFHVMLTPCLVSSCLASPEIPSPGIHDLSLQENMQKR